MIECEFQPHGDEIDIIFKGKINFSHMGEFIKELDSLDKTFKACNIDLTKLFEIDSSALGMLLILLDHQPLKGGKFVLKIQKTGYVNEQLLAHNFQQLFTIEIVE